jgi:hypothetical protein
MRFLKIMLTILYIFLGLFTVACFVNWCVTGTEPQALIMGVFGGIGIESIVAGVIKVREKKDEKNEGIDSDGSAETNIDNRRE